MIQHAVAAGVLLLAASTAQADEGGVSFWVPGFFGSLAAVPPTPGWSVATIYYHTSTDVGANAQFLRGGAIVAGLVADADLGFVSPSYAFATPVLWGGLATVSVLAAYGHLDASVDVTLARPLGRTVSLSRTDDRTGFGDLPIFGKLNWNAGVNNYMLYTAVNVPNGRNPCERPGDDEQPAAELESYDSRQQHAGHAEPRHVGRGAAVAADEAPSLVHEDEGQQKPAREQASCGWPVPHCM